MLIDHAKLQKVAEGILRASGSDADEAEIVAAHLVRANLTGHDSHGVGMIPAYMLNRRNGLLCPNTPARLVADAGGILRFEGDRGYGQRVALEAMAAGIERAKETGLVLVSLANAHHIGRIGMYGEQAIAAGLVSLHFVNVVDHAPLVAPFRGADARFGTNPICIAVPGGEMSEPILLDMATSKIALGKARVAMNKGDEVAPDRLLGPNGQPTKDPSVMFEEPRGALIAMGDHKGYGLAFMCELLAGVLTGGGTIQPGHARQNSIVNHMFAVIVDPAKLVDFVWMQREVDAVVDYFLASPQRTAGEPVLKPGDPERMTAADRQANGIPVDDTTWREIGLAGDDVGFGAADIEAVLGG